MKIRKPDDEKFFKDIVLNDILEEISNEDGVTPNDTSKALKKSSPKKRHSGKKTLFIGVSILLLIGIVIIFKFVADATTVAEDTPAKTTVTNTENWKMEEDIAGYKKSVSTKVVEEKPVLAKGVKSTPVKIKPIPIQKTERELAKEALRQQMLN